MVIYPNAIVDHHFDELNFLSTMMCCLSYLVSMYLVVTFTVRLCFNLPRAAATVFWLLIKTDCMPSFVQIVGPVRSVQNEL